MPESPHTLSKSRLVSGLQCRKRLYLETHNRELVSEPGVGLQRIFDSGHALGELAQKEFPEGRLIYAPFYDTATALRDTESALEAGVEVLYEPAFLYRGVLVRAASCCVMHQTLRVSLQSTLLEPRSRTLDLHHPKAERAKDLPAGG